MQCKTQMQEATRCILRDAIYASLHAVIIRLWPKRPTLNSIHSQLDWLKQSQLFLYYCLLQGLECLWMNNKRDQSVNHTILSVKWYSERSCLPHPPMLLITHKLTLSQWNLLHSFPTIATEVRVDLLSDWESEIQASRWAVKHQIKTSSPSQMNELHHGWRGAWMMAGMNPDDSESGPSQILRHREYSQTHASSHSSILLTFLTFTLLNKGFYTSLKA